MDYIWRIKEVLKFSGLSTRAFAIKCGLNSPTLERQIKGLRSVSLDVISGILFAFPEISTDWMMRGEGEMLKSNDKNMERLDKLVDTIATLQDTINIKSQMIETLQGKIKQLENPLKNK